jgi:serine protease AprX
MKYDDMNFTRRKSLMFGFSMVNVVRRYSHKIDRTLRQELLGLYRPLRWIPCFMHDSIEKRLKNVKKYPVIVEFDQQNDGYHSGLADLHSLANNNRRCHVKHHYSSVSCCSAELTAAALEELVTKCAHVRKIHFDRKVTALLDVAGPSINSRVLNRNGLTGKGITIAIVDTGIYLHKDLQSPENRFTAFKDFVNNRTNPYDDNGHGTHCAGDAAGNGHASNGQYMGPAPEAKLVGVKVLDRTGSGSLSTVMAGIQWCIDNKLDHSIDIISLSLGSSATQSAQDDPMVKIVESAWDKGIVVCAAAGNDGPDEMTIASPGISPKIITIGAMDDKNTSLRTDDKPAEFSSRGPTSIDHFIKPDLLVPGVNIISWRSPNSFLDKTTKSNRVGGDYFSLSGTSMATPICAGVAALVLQKNKGLQPNDVKEKLLNSAEDWGLAPTTQGKGYLDAEKAIR